MRLALTAASALLIAGLTGCSAEGDDTSTTTPSPSATPTEAATDETPESGEVSYSDLLTATFNNNHTLDELFDSMAAEATQGGLDESAVIETLNASAEADGLLFRVQTVNVEAGTITCSVAGDRYLYSFEDEANFEFGLYLGEGVEACESPEAAEAGADHVLTAVMDEANGGFVMEVGDDSAEGAALAEQATALIQSGSAE